ncbi:MAG: hypothetical protein WD226_13175 [Planctomycetota bacterium]
MMWTFLVLAAAMVAAPPVDVLPRGDHRVKNEVVFVESEALRAVRLVASPTAGFGGVEEVEVGQPFPYSLKYGTKVYAVPRGIELEFPSSFRDQDWPCSTVEIGGHDTASDFSPVYARLITVKLLAVGPERLELERVDRVEIDQNGQPVDPSMIYLRTAGWVALGLFLLIALRRHRQRRAAKAACSDPRTEEGSGIAEQL